MLPVGRTALHPNMAPRPIPAYLQSHVRPLRPVHDPRQPRDGVRHQQCRAELPAQLEPAAQPAGARGAAQPQDRRAQPRRAALGPDPALRARSGPRPHAQQRPGRDGGEAAELPRRLCGPALHRAGRGVLRVEARRQAEAAPSPSRVPTARRSPLAASGKAGPIRRAATSPGASPSSPRKRTRP